MPLETITSGYSIHKVGAVIDYQMQRICGFRTMQVMVCRIVSPCFSEYSSIPIVAFTSGSRGYVAG